MKQLEDERIGILREDGSRQKWPLRYANGVLWNRQAESSPTMAKFGPGRKFFYVLPVKLPKIDDDIRRELEANVDAFVAQFEEKPEPAKPTTRRKRSTNKKTTTSRKSSASRKEDISVEESK